MNRKQRRAGGKPGDPGLRGGAAGAQAVFADALRHHQLGRLSEAEGLYRRVLALDSRHADSLHLLGVIAAQAGRYPQAVDLFRKAITINAKAAPYHCNLGNALHRGGKLDEAVACYREAIAINPDYVEAHSYLGVVLQKQGKLGDAVAQYTQVLRINPGNAQARSNLGNALQEQGKLDDAIAQYAEALRINPGFHPAHYNLGMALQTQGRLDEAIASYRRAIAIKPDYPQAYTSLGTALQRQGRLDDAVACYHKAVAIAPDHDRALYYLGSALQAQGKPDEAIARYGEFLRFNPDSPEALSQLVHLRRHICDWREFQEDENRMARIAREHPAKVTPSLLLIHSSTEADQQACARAYFGERMAGIAPMVPIQPAPRHGRIRIGYLSGDFHRHAITFLTTELFERHDRSRFEIFGYSYGPDDGSEARQRLIAAFDHFVDMREVGNAEAAARIRDDGIDILVDLKGPTGADRAEILAFRPAPVQVNHLGYPGTMGTDFMDYILADPLVVPMESQSFYSERIVHLPECYQPNDSKRVIGDPVPSRAACGLPEQGLVFCCFNNSFKITPDLFDIWMRLLRATPGSVLWLLEANVLVQSNLRREAGVRGITPERLVFAPRQPLAEHLARHRQADLFLDTLPYNAHTTASDALWTGLPVLTCAGGTFAGRVAGSLLTAIGLPELITTSLADYEALALRLAHEPALLAALKDKLARNRSAAPLFDTERFTRHMETAYGRMWETWCAGKPPTAFAVEPAPS